MAAHLVSAKYTGVDSDGNLWIVYEAADLGGGMQYVGGVDSIKGTAMGAVSGSVGSIKLPPEYAGKTITLDLYGGAVVPNVIIDSTFVSIQEAAHGVPGALLCRQNAVVSFPGPERQWVGYYQVLDGVRVQQGGGNNPGPSPSTTLVNIYTNTEAVEFTFGEYKCNAIHKGPFCRGEDVPSAYEQVVDGILEMTAKEGVWVDGEEPPEGECSQDLIIRFTDDPDRVAVVFYTAVGGLPNIPVKSATQFTIPCKPNTEVTINVGITANTIASFKSFRACTGEVEEIPLQTGEPPEIPPEIPPEELITQLIIVRKAGEGQEEYITGAAVTVNGKACEGLPDGLYSVEIEEGIEATAEVKAEGYKDKTQTFTTTSMATVMIVLEPIAIEGESDQEFTLVDADGNPIEGAAVTVGDKTCFTDSNGKCTITAPIGEATTATITKPGYADVEIPITPDAGGNEYPVGLVREDELFSLPGNLKADFDSETVTPAIKTVFSASGIPLSDDATIKKIDDDTWEVIDGEDVYTVEEEEGVLNVYSGGGGGGGGPTPPSEIPPEIPPEPPEPPEPPPPGEPRWDSVEFDTWVDDSNKARIKYKGIDLIPETEYHGVFEVMFPPEVHVGTLINATTLAGDVDIDATMNEGKTVEIRLYEYASGKPSKIIDRKDVAIPMRPELDQVEVILGPEMLALWQQNPALKVHCDELLDYAWPFLAWFPPMSGLEVRKTVTDGKAIFNAADGLVKGKEYIFHMYPQLALEELIKQNAVKFGYTPSVTLTKTNIMEEVLCPFFGFEPGSVECENEVNEFVDAYYVANTIKKLATGKNLLGKADTADTFDIIFMPIIMLGAAGPFIPVGKTLKAALGPIINLMHKGNKGAWLAKNQHKMHLLLAAGKGSSLEEAKKLMALGKWDEAERLLDNVVTEIHNSPTLSATARENLAGWNAGARKLLDDNPQMKTKIDDLTDEAVDGTIFKTHFDTVVKGFDDAAKAGDWVKAKQIWIDGVAGSTDNLVYFDMNLVKASPEFQMVHNILRYTTPEYITALKGANRYDIGVRFLVNHIGETGKEIEKYQLFIERLDGLLLDDIATNLRAAGGEGKTVASVIDDSFRIMAKAEVENIPITPSQKVGGVSDNIYRTTADPEIKNVMADRYATIFDELGDSEMANMIRELGKTMPPSESAMKVITDAAAEVRRARTAAGATKHISRWNRVRKHSLLIGIAALVAGKELLGIGGFGMFIPEEGVQTANFGFMNLIHNKMWDLAKTYYPNLQEVVGDAKATSNIFGKLNPFLKPAFDIFFQGADLKVEIDGEIIKARADLSFESVVNFTAPTYDTLFLEVLHDGTKMLAAGMYFHNFPQWTIKPAEVVSACNQADRIVGWNLDKQFDILSQYGLDKAKATAKSVDLANDINGLNAKGVPFYFVALENNIPYIPSPEKATDADSRFVPYVSELVAGRLLSMPKEEEEILSFLIKRAGAFKDLYTVGVEKGRVSILGKGFGSLYIYSTPSKANIFMTGGEWDHHLLGLTGTLHSNVPPGVYSVALEVDGYIPLTVPDVQILPGAPTTVEVQTLKPSEGAIRCYRVANEEYLDRKADILYKKHSDTVWIKTGKSVPISAGGYTPIEGLEVGVEYDVKYNFLEVLECINGEVLTIPPEGWIDCKMCQLNSCLPEKVITTVREVIDGDSFRTDFTNDLPKRFYGGELLPQEVRIIGCNCYEVGSPIGQVAKEKLADLIEGKNVTLLIDKNLPLGYYNRVIAGVFYPDDSNHPANDVAGKLIEACVVREYPTSSKQDTYSWDPYSSYLNKKWADHTPELCVRSTDDDGKPLISMTTDPATKTVQMHNRWLPVYAVVRMFKVGVPFYTVTDYAQKALYASSASYGYRDATSLKLYASTEPIDDKNTGFEIETFIISDIVDTYDVTFTSSPAGAKVTTIPGTISISRLTTVLRSHRDSTPISRFVKRQKHK